LTQEQLGQGAFDSLIGVAGFQKMKRRLRKKKQQQQLES
jgi:hypothetical protein